MERLFLVKEVKRSQFNFTTPKGEKVKRDKVEITLGYHKLKSPYGQPTQVFMEYLVVSLFDLEALDWNCPEGSMVVAELSFGVNETTNQNNNETRRYMYCLLKRYAKVYEDQYGQY